MSQPASASPVPRTGCWVGFPAAWIAAAQFERDRRAEHYPRIVGQEPARTEALTLDYQAWCAIAEWMAQGRCSLIGGWGGEADPPETVISWAFLEECVANALASIEAKVERDAASPDVSIADLAATRERLECVWCIHSVMVRQRESVEALNRQTDQVRRALVCRGQAKRGAGRSREHAE